MGIILIYILPSLLALLGKHPKKWQIVALNVLLGWVPLAWLVLLVWAARPQGTDTGRKKPFEQAPPRGPWTAPSATESQPATSQRPFQDLAGQLSDLGQHFKAQLAEFERQSKVRRATPRFIDPKEFSARTKGELGELAVVMAVEGAGFDHIEDLYLPLRNGVTQIDHVVLAGGTIVVIETKNYAGWVFGTYGQAEWTVSMPGGRSRHKFQNPIRQNYAHLSAVREQIPATVPTVGLVAFVGTASFPRGMPEGVTALSGLVAKLRSIAQAHPATSEALTAWEALKSTVEGTDKDAAVRMHQEGWQGPWDKAR